MNQAFAFYYPNRMGRIILESMEELIGRNGLNVILNTAGQSQLIDHVHPSDLQPGFSFATVSGLLAQLEHEYGPRGGRGIAIRIGRVAFKYGMREYASQMGMSETSFRLMPPGAKIRAGGQALADLFNKESDQRVSLIEQDGKLLWNIERCPMCWGRHAEDVVCHFMVGLLQESLYWLSGGKIFNVEETLCIAKGDPTCTFEIDQTPFA
jgi:predicted hydrocarbon binding protein